MTTIKLPLITVIALSTTACSGHLYTILKPDLSVGDGNQKKIEGVIVYPTVDVIEIYQTTALLDKETKKVIGSAPDQCTPKRSLKFSTRADYTNPYRNYSLPIRINKPALIEA